MTSVLHPVGPEPSQTYWVRRLVVIASAVLVLAIVVVLIINGTSRGSAVQADPAPPAAAPVPASTPTPTTMSSSMRTPGSSASASGSASPPAKATASGQATTSASATPTSSASKATPKATPKPSASKTAKSTKPAGPVACQPSELRPTLTGKPRLKPKQKGTFALSLINGSDQTCTVGLTGKNFVLKIYSGKDRIWSTDDCATAVKPLTDKLKSQDAMTWSMTWNGRRSKSGCGQRPEIPRAGTYVATAQFTGAKVVRLRFFLRK